MFLLCVSNNKKYNSNNNFYYYNYLCLILYKLNLYHPNIPVYLYLFKFSEKHIKQLLKLHSNIIYYVEKSKEYEDNIKGYISNIRINTIKEAFLIYKKKYIIYLDCDIIIRKPLDDLISQIEKSDNNTIIVSKRDKDTTDLKIFYNTGIICIKNGDHINDFLTYWNNYIIKNEYKWYSDQIGLYNSSIKFEDNINIINLNKTYNDCPSIYKIKNMYNKNSHIWHCQNEYSSEKWINQFYLEYYKLVLKDIIDNTKVIY